LNQGFFCSSFSQPLHGMLTNTFLVLLICSFITVFAPNPCGDALASRNCTNPKAYCPTTQPSVACHCTMTDDSCGGAEPVVEDESRSWGYVVWAILGAVIGLLCLDRLWTSCKKAYNRRQGASSAGFNPVESEEDAQTSQGISVNEMSAKEPTRVSSAGARTDNDEL